MTANAVTIRDERPEDAPAIFRVTQLAFEGRPYSRQTEQFIVNALREAHALTLSLVAEADGEVVGHIAFSPVTLSSGAGGWYGLGPLSVLPRWQRQGIGQALVRAGLTRLQAFQPQGCVLLGSPQYYTRFGFANTPRLTLEGVAQEFFMALAFVENEAQGRVLFHPAFSAEK